MRERKQFGRKRRYYTYSSPLTLEQIQFLRDSPDPPALLREIVDEGIARRRKTKERALEKKLEALQEKHSLLMQADHIIDGRKLLHEIDDLRLQLGLICESSWLTHEIAWPRDEIGKKERRSTQERTQAAEKLLKKLKDKWENDG